MSPSTPEVAGGDAAEVAAAPGRAVTTTVGPRLNPLLVVLAVVVGVAVFGSLMLARRPSSPEPSADDGP